MGDLQKTLQKKKLGRDAKREHGNESTRACTLKTQSRLGRVGNYLTFSSNSDSVDRGHRISILLSLQAARQGRLEYDMKARIELRMDR